MRPLEADIGADDGRTFRDPLTGGVLSDPSPTDYRVTFSVKGGRRETTTISTLAEARPPESFFKKRIAKMPRTADRYMTGVVPGNVTIHEVKKR